MIQVPRLPRTTGSKEETLCRRRSSGSPAAANLPSQLDPRGLLAFGLTGLALLVAARLIVAGSQLPRSLGYFTYLAGGLLIVVYLARLIVLDPANPALLVPVLVAGFVVSPVWYVCLGLALRAEPDARPETLPTARLA